MTIIQFYDKNEFRIHQSQRIQRNEVRKNIITNKRKEKTFFKQNTAKKGKKEERRKKIEKACFCFGVAIFLPRPSLARSSNRMILSKRFL